MRLLKLQEGRDSRDDPAVLRSTTYDDDDNGDRVFSQYYFSYICRAILSVSFFSFATACIISGTGVRKTCYYALKRPHRLVNK